MIQKSVTQDLLHRRAAFYSRIQLIQTQTLQKTETDLSRPLPDYMLHHAKKTFTFPSTEVYALINEMLTQSADRAVVGLVT